MLHAGSDRICDPRGTVEFYERLGSVDKTYKIYPGMYHEIFNEIGKEEVFADIRAWMDERM
jgi:alpha-beta hydrolase superfamily lysophospholipase